jgi:hypothetical protein
VRQNRRAQTDRNEILHGKYEREFARMVAASRVGGTIAEKTKMQETLVLRAQLASLLGRAVEPRNSCRCNFAITSHDLGVRFLCTLD